MEGDVLRAAHQMQAQQAAAAGLRAHYAGLALPVLLDWHVRALEADEAITPADMQTIGRRAVALSDAVIDALREPPAHRS